MRRALLPGCLALTLLLLSLFFIFIPQQSTIAQVTAVRVTPTATPDSATILAKADDEVTQSQNLLNFMNLQSQILAAVMAVFGVVTIFLGVFGFFTNNGFRDLEKEWRTRLSELTLQQSDAEERSRAITQLTAEVEEKSQQIESLRLELLAKSKDIGDLEQLVSIQEGVTKRLEDNSNALLNYMLGELLQEQKRTRQALSAFERARELRPHDPQFNYALGRIYSNIGRYDEAISCLENAIGHDPGLAQAHMELGLAYRRRADSLFTPQDEQLTIEYRKAIQHLQEATNLLPNYEDALAGLGAIYRRMKRYNEALTYYKHAFEADRSSSYALSNLATIAWHEGDIEAAHEAFQRTLELATMRIDAGSSFEPFWNYYDRALAQLVLGQREGALSDYDVAIKQTSSQKNFESVLDTLKFLQEVQEQYPIEGLGEVIRLIDNARIQAASLLA